MHKAPTHLLCETKNHPGQNLNNAIAVLALSFKDVLYWIKEITFFPTSVCFHQNRLLNFCLYFFSASREMIVYVLPLSINIVNYQQVALTKCHRLGEKFIFHSFGGWKPEIRGATVARFLWGLFCWLVTLLSHMAKREKSSLLCLIKALISFMRAPPL